MKSIEEQLIEKAIAFKGESGQPYTNLKIEVRVNGDKPTVVWTAYAHTGTHREAATCEDAIAASLNEVQPAIRAERLRAQVAALLAEAEALA
jgi:hypothetical protein